ncbi:MAG: DUF1573 domain-containing protein, partial [Nitrospirae bacterium]|nr:DUF1573 domain-containing protein [Nitrospirota bacterium]
LEEGRLLSFDIPLKNTTTKPLNIISLEPSCGCVNAVVINGSIGRGDTGIIRVTIDTTGKIGKVMKTIEVVTDISATPFVLKLRALVKHSGNGVANAGAIFHGDCRKCHVGTDIKSKQGEILYNAVCFMCHKNYSTYKHLSKESLEKSISDGITNTSMPGFAETNGGPLSPEQISSLIDFLKKQK